MNDFDETTIGPWEWDLKRLTASVNVLGRENQFSAKDRRSAVMLCVAGYRAQMQRVQSMGVLDLWDVHTVADRVDIETIERMYPRAARLWRPRTRAAAIFFALALLPGVDLGASRICRAGANVPATGDEPCDRGGTTV